MAVSILIFLDSPATGDFRVDGQRRFTEVSILIFLDSPATRGVIQEDMLDYMNGFNPYFPGLSCNNFGIS